MQNNVSICTDEKDLDIKYGMINFGEEREAARTSVKYMLSDVNDIRHSYIRLGFHLNEFDRMNYYKDFGYSSLFDFCDVNLGLDKSAVSRCISVFKAFAKENNTINHAKTMFLDDRYEKYSYSQLCEMVSMTDKQRVMVKPEMTIKQIRELKKKNVSWSEENVSPVATSQQNEYNFDYGKYRSYSGIVQRNHVKYSKNLGTKQVLIFDKDGNCLRDNLFVDVLANKNDMIVLRFHKADETL